MKGLKLVYALYNFILGHRQGLTVNEETQLINVLNSTKRLCVTLKGSVPNFNSQLLTQNAVKPNRVKHFSMNIDGDFIISYEYKIKESLPNKGFQEIPELQFRFHRHLLIHVEITEVYMEFL